MGRTNIKGNTIHETGKNLVITDKNRIIEFKSIDRDQEVEVYVRAYGGGTLFIDIDRNGAEAIIDHLKIQFGL